MEIVTVSVNGTGKAYPRGTSLYEISRDYQKDYNADIILASKDGSLRELSKKVYENCAVRFLTVADSDGYRTYRRGMILLMLKAFELVLDGKEEYSVNVEHSIHGALYCELEETFGKKIDLVTVRAIMQDSSMESNIDFRNTVLRERVKLHDVA